jgi:release factor glutamine methyltransferase
MEMNEILYQRLLDRIQQHWAGLPDKPEETPETTLVALWRCVAGLDPGGKLDAEGDARLTALVERRIGGEPLAYLTGSQLFMGIDFLSSPEAMIPRKETEILGKAALKLTEQLAQELEAVKIIDLCTGSGNIALTLAHYEPLCVVFGADLSEDAVQLATRNALRLGLAARAHFFSGDLFAPFEQPEFLGQMDLVTCNPPYISSAQVEKLPGEILHHEPYLAFDGGPFGIRILTRVIREAPRFLKPGGWVCFEVGLGQGKALLNMINKSGLYSNVEASNDEAGEIRVLQARLI